MQHEHIEQGWGVISVLFRYRDLIADTITEHKNVLKVKKQCWWGWWKRPTEEGREDIWAPLSKQIKEEGYAEVGLFDSGATDTNSAVRIAKVVEVVLPQKSGGSWVSPELSTDQLDMVPEYYRRSPFSRAWLKIESISEPVPFFGEYSFDRPPPLPQIAPADLERLSGKRILDSPELRAMDTTIWSVRRAIEGDSSERFLAPGQQILKAMSSDPIAMAGNAILHLSDIHFAALTNRAQHAWGYPEEHRPKLMDEIGAAVAKKGIGLVVVTGDFTFVASKDEFKLAGKAVNTLLGKLGLGSNHLIIIPGNHDIAWTKGEATYKPEAEVSFDLTEASKNYREFYRILFRHEPNEKLSMSRRYITPSGIVLEIGALNTSSLETGKNYLAGMGRIHPSALREAVDALSWESRGASLALRILALHHHLTATEDVEDPQEFGRGFGMAIDSKKTLREAAKFGVQLVLHGHRHRAFVWRETVFGLPEEAQQSWSLGDVSILGGGSAGSSEVHNKSNYFNIVDVNAAQIQVSLFRSKDCSRFESIRDWRAKLTAHQGQLVLGTWESP